MSGSCLTTDLRDSVNEPSSVSSVCIWVIPSMVYSIGSSIETICLSPSFISFRRHLSVVDFPDPVGPHISTKPLLSPRVFLITASSSTEIPRELRLEGTLSGFRILIDTFSFSIVFTIETLISIS